MIPMPTRQAYFWLAGIGIFFILIVAGVMAERRRLFALRIERGSMRLKRLREINSRYQFDQEIEELYEYHIFCKTKPVSYTHLKRRAVEQHAAKRMLFIQQRQRGDEQQRAERVDLRGSA